jgi:hypothetical protein
MMKWVDEIANRDWIEKLVFSKERLIYQMIWLSDLINWILSHYIIIAFFMHERFDFESHLLIWNHSYRRFFINLLISRRVVLRSFNRDDLFKLRWFFSYLLIFEIVEKSMSTKMSMRFWWDQIEVTTKLEDSLIRRKNLVTIEDLDSQKDLDESWNKKSINEIVKKEFLYNELIFSFRLNKQQLAFRQSIRIRQLWVRQAFDLSIIQNLLLIDWIVSFFRFILFFVVLSIFELIRYRRCLSSSVQ